MKFDELPIRRKVTAAIMLTSITVVLLTVAAFVTYDIVTLRQSSVQNFSTLAKFVAWDSSAALAFSNEKDAQRALNFLSTQPQILRAAIYDAHGKLFVTYPENVATNKFPPTPETGGNEFTHDRLLVYQGVFENTTRYGTVYLEADLHFLYQRLELYALVAGLIILCSIIVTLVLSNRLQRNVSDPILALAGTARRVSEWRDYSVRASKFSNDELGVLTDAFNQMLTRIQEQTIAVQESEGRLRLALEASSTGVWDWNLETQELNWDKDTCRLFGLKPGEFRSTYEHFVELVHPDSRDAIQQAVESSIHAKREFAREFKIRWPDGSIHEMLTRGGAFYNAFGKPVRMSGVVQDITERKRSEEASRRLAAIVESTDDAIVGKDLNGYVTSWNKAAERMFGYSAEEIVGQSIERLVAPEDAGLEDRILAAVKNGETRLYETRRVRKNGDFINVSLTISPLRNDKGEIVGASSISRDITERIQAQDSLQRQARMLREQAQMLDLANVMARDMTDRIILWNTGMERMYGYLRTETLGRLSHDVLKTEFPRPLDEILSILMRDGQWEGELRHCRKDGKMLTVSSLWVLHKDPQGNPMAILEVNTDITARKLAEEKILHLNAELETRVRERTAELIATNQELEAFTYSVAHDLRAPLRHIDAFTKIIFDDFADQIPEQACRFLENIRKGSQNMNHLVDDLLNLARVGRQELKREVAPLEPIVQEVINDLKRDTAGRQIDWRVHPLPQAEVDAGLIRQVFINLLSNAVKYSRPRKEAIIEIGVKKIDGESAIYIQDNGVGFSMKYANKLFGVFQRLHRADEFEGTGVGLATVDRIIRKHGGRIWAESEVDNGATFYFTLSGLTPPNIAG